VSDPCTHGWLPISAAIERGFDGCFRRARRCGRSRSRCPRRRSLFSFIFLFRSCWLIRGQGRMACFGFDDDERKGEKRRRRGSVCRKMVVSDRLMHHARAVLDAEVCVRRCRQRQTGQAGIHDRQDQTGRQRGGDRIHTRAKTGISRTGAGWGGRDHTRAPEHRMAEHSTGRQAGRQTDKTGRQRHAEHSIAEYNISYHAPGRVGRPGMVMMSPASA
jgi:hypothetical protein